MNETQQFVQQHELPTDESLHEPALLPVHETGPTQSIPQSEEPAEVQWSWKLSPQYAAAETPRGKVSRRTVLLGVGLPVGIFGAVGLGYGGAAYSDWINKVSRPSPGIPVMPVIPTPVQSTLEEQPDVVEKYPKHTVTVSMCWIGQKRKHTGTDTVWARGRDPLLDEPYPVALFGGVDDPKKRDQEGMPVGFTILHNPFYFNLGMSDFRGKHVLYDTWLDSPFKKDIAGTPTDGSQSIFKNQWAEFTYNGIVQYAQWYNAAVKDTKKPERAKWVFGKESVEPKDEVQVEISPTMLFKFGLPMNGDKVRVTFRFINFEDVPPGPWLGDYPLINNYTYGVVD